MPSFWDDNVLSDLDNAALDTAALLGEVSGDFDTLLGNLASEGATVDTAQLMANMLERFNVLSNAIADLQAESTIGFAPVGGLPAPSPDASLPVSRSHEGYNLLVVDDSFLATGEGSSRGEFSDFEDAWNYISKGGLSHLAWIYWNGSTYEVFVGNS